MKQIKTKSGNILCVEVPKDAEDFELISQNYYLRYKTKGFNHNENPWSSLKEIKLI